eukprot:g60844.t1
MKWSQEPCHRRAKRVKPIRDGDFSKCFLCSEIAADHRSGFKTKQEGDNWRTHNRVHNKIHRACRRGSIRRAVEGGKDIQRVTSMTIDMTKPFHLPWSSRGSSDFRVLGRKSGFCLHQATRLGAADEAAECGLVILAT